MFHLKNMVPANEAESGSKSKSKRNKRKKCRSSNLLNSSDNNGKTDDNSFKDVTIENLQTISIERGSQQLMQQQQQTSSEGLSMQQAVGPTLHQQQHQHESENPKDEDENIAVDLEHQCVLFQVEKILSSTSGRSDLVFLVVRLKPIESDRPVSCIYLGEAQRNNATDSRNSLSLGGVTLRLNDRIIAHVPAEGLNSSNIHLRVISFIATLRTSIIYLKHREEIYIQLIQFYRRFVHLPRDLFQELKKLNEFWRQLHLLEQYITDTSRLSFSTSNPAQFTKHKIPTEKPKMVHDTGSNAAAGNGGVVNSTSLEDVPLSEASDRAQSIQSLHSTVETPTPDCTPSFDELQQRLEEYNRHIAHMNDQKEELMRMHNDAKQHLKLLEQYQRECNERNLSFGEKDQVDENGERQPPDYNSVSEVKNDMSILAQRVQNITRLVNNQKKLVEQLPDEAAEDVRADQENLERKLRDLRKNGDDLHLMASELDTLNTNVSNPKESVPTPEEASRFVPIRTTPNDAGSLKSIEQKESEIEAMKTQLRRLKDMMGTIESIEAKALDAKQAEAKQSNSTEARNVPIRTVGGRGNSNYGMAYDDEHERTPTPRSFIANSELERNLRILNGVSSDVRAQSQRMDAEKERIMALQDEISRCSQQAAAAAQLGEDALKRHSVTPTPTPMQRKDSDHESYEKPNKELENMLYAKSQEYEEVCRRLQELRSQSSQQNVQQPPIAPVQKLANAPEEPGRPAEHENRRHSRNLETLGHSNDSAFEATSSTDTTGLGNNSTSVMHDDVSADTSSMQSNGSTSNAFSMPPSMAAINSGITWAGGPHAWNPASFRYTHPGSIISPTCSYPPLPASFAPFNISIPPPPVSLSVLTGPSSANAPFYNPTSIPTPPSTLPPLIGPALLDQTMLQTCINQQQIFSQVLNQLNSMLFQQQREIDYLHRITQTLQERLIRLGGEPIVHIPDIGIGFRSESVPPTFSAATAVFPPYGQPHLNTINNLYTNCGNRAQSEQPIQNSTDGNAKSQYHQEQHRFVQQHHHQTHQQQQQQQQQRQFSSNMGPGQVGSTGIYNETQQHAASSATTGGSSSVYSTLNNANVNGCNRRPPVQPTTMGQETGGGPAPIFMHHHNNAIHQNNANLRRANVHPSTTHTHSHLNCSSGGTSSNDSNNTLNNQVPPGNRANNYWDNFKSYSRQNLLAPQTSKSNEDYQQALMTEINGTEYCPEAPRVRQAPRQTSRHPQQLPVHYKCFHREFESPPPTLNVDPNLIGIRNRDMSNHNNKFVRLGNQTRIKNFQQCQRQQQPNPLPLGTVITNPLHANIPVNGHGDNGTATDTFVVPAEHMTEIPSGILAYSQLQTSPSSFNYPVNELEDQITAEIYGCNYEHPSTSSSTSTQINANTNERNLNFGNSPGNRQGNKVAPKFEYSMGLLTDQSMRMIETFLEHWDDAAAEGNQDLVLNNRQNINRYLRQLYQLQSTLRFDPSYIGQSANSHRTNLIGCHQQMYMRDDYDNGDEDDGGQENELLFSQSENGQDNRDDRMFISTDVNINRTHPIGRCSNINRSVFERNLLVNNGNTRKPEKFVKKETVPVVRRYPMSRLDDASEESQATFSDSTDQRRGLKNRVSDFYGLDNQVDRWFKRSATKNVQMGNQETVTIRHALSDSNVTGTRNDLLEHPTDSLIEQSNPIPNIPSEGTTDSETIIQVKANEEHEHGMEIAVGESSLPYEDIDSLGASSLAAQEHFQKKSLFKDKSKDRKTLDKQKKSQPSIEIENDKKVKYEDKQNDVVSCETPLLEEYIEERPEYTGERIGLRLDVDRRALIHIVMACLRADLKSIVLLDNNVLEIIAQITASITQNTLLSRDIQPNDGVLALLSSEKLLAELNADINMPKRFAKFIIWYEKFLEKLLLETSAEDHGCQKEKSTVGLHHHLLHTDKIPKHNNRKIITKLTENIENSEKSSRQSPRKQSARNMSTSEAAFEENSIMNATHATDNIDKKPSEKPLKTSNQRKQRKRNNKNRGKR